MSARDDHLVAVEELRQSEQNLQDLLGAEGATKEKLLSLIGVVAAAKVSALMDDGDATWLNELKVPGFDVALIAGLLALTSSFFSLLASTKSSATTDVIRNGFIEATLIEIRDLQAQLNATQEAKNAE